MKRTTRTALFGLTALGALALPIGLVSADDADEPIDEPAVVCEQEQKQYRQQDGSGDQVRQRLQAEACDGECDGSQVRARAEDSAMEPQGQQQQERLQAEECDGDCEPQREQSSDADLQRDRLNDGSGAMQRRAGR